MEMNPREERVKNYSFITERWHEDKQLWDFFLLLIGEAGEQRWFETNYTWLSEQTGLSFKTLKNWLAVLRKEGAIAVNRFSKQRMNISILRFWKDTNKVSRNEADARA